MTDAQTPPPAVAEALERLRDRFHGCGYAGDPIADLALIAAHLHAGAGPGDREPQVQKLREAHVEVDRLRLRLRGADRVMQAIDDAVDRHVIDARSSIADARLDYGAPHTAELAGAGPGARPDREALGQQVRAVWIAWAREQPSPKASWLVPWEGLSEPDKEVDRRIGETLAQAGAGPGGERALIDTPEILDFVEGVKREAAHQRERWQGEHDAAKAPEDWYWLVGYLAGKALYAQRSGDADKMRHHAISTAAVLYNWHALLPAPAPATETT